MAIMPHTDVEAALSLALSLDVPFWPQLPHLGFEEDMYVQSLAGFPGVRVETAQERILFDKGAFISELDAHLGELDDSLVRAGASASRPYDSAAGTSRPPAGSRISPLVTAVGYEPFINSDLSMHPAIRGQVMGPISCGFRLIDQDKKPVIYDDDVRPLLLEFVARQANVQLRTLAAHNPNVFIFMDEPGLGMVFSGLSGYNEARADVDLRFALDSVAGPVAIHLCGQPDWDFLLRLPIAMLSFNAFASGKTFVTRTDNVRTFIDRGGILCWGIVPTHEAMLEKISIPYLADQMSGLIETLLDSGIRRDALLDQSMLAPATCNLAGTPESVELAFEALRELALEMRRRWA